MKLAEALLERKDLLKRLEVLRERLVADAKVQEGDQPAGDPEELLSEAEGLCQRLKGMVVAINRANSRACLPDGRTLTEAIAERDVLRLWHELLAAVAEAAVPSRDRFGLGRQEIKYVPTVDVAALRKRADEVAKACRELDAEIQAANWEAEL
ncbi:MAG: DIP1984 family protein [Bacillota bacterium]